jgi:ABC-type sugar transport system permease subunit
MGISGKPGPSRAWFILPSLLLLAGVILAGIGISSFVSFARSDFRAYQPDSSISVTKDGFTLYAEDGTLAANDLRDLRCTATGPDGQMRLQPISGHTTMSKGNSTFVAIASTPKDVSAGRYVISCETMRAGLDVPLYLGPRVDLAAVGRLAVFGIVAPLFLGICSIVLFAILAVLRFRSRRITPEGS